MAWHFTVWMPMVEQCEPTVVDGVVVTLPPGREPGDQRDLGDDQHDPAQAAPVHRSALGQHQRRENVERHEDDRREVIDMRSEARIPVLRREALSAVSSEQRQCDGEGAASVEPERHRAGQPEHRVGRKRAQAGERRWQGKVGRCEQRRGDKNAAWHQHRPEPLGERSGHSPYCRRICAALVPDRNPDQVDDLIRVSSDVACFQGGEAHSIRPRRAGRDGSRRRTRGRAGRACPRNP